MALLIPNPYGSTISAAFKLARERGIFPTWMGTVEIRELKRAVKEHAVFSARTTNAVYLDELKQRIERYLANGYDGDQAKLRLELKDILTRMQYDPVTGFPGDEKLGIPPARAGSLQDLSSDRRINLILDTQLKLMAGKGQEQQGLSEAALDLFPAYELIRIEARRVPREWLKDWETAAENVDWQGVSKDAFKQGRMIALKTSPIWAAVGSSALFPDALDVSHPPFRFGSGMGWEVKDRETALRWGLDVEGETHAPVPTAVRKLPPATISTNGLSKTTLDRLKKVMDNAVANHGRLTLESVFGNAPPPKKKQRMNAASLCDGLDCLMLLDDDVRINARKRRKRKGRGGKFETPPKRCGNTWIAGWKECHCGLPAQGPKGKGKIGQDGTAEELGLPDLREMHALPRTAKMTAKDAMQQIHEGVTLTDPLNRTVKFEGIVEKHLQMKAESGDVNRAAYLPQAKEAVSQPHEIWEHQHRHRYIASFERSDGSKAFLVAASRHAENENRAITFQPVDWRHIKKWRLGKLLYTAY